MTTKKRPIKIRVGDTCPDCKKGKLLMTLTCEDDTCGCTVHPADGYQIELVNDEGDLCALILRHVHLLTCYNCGEKLQDKVRLKDDVVGVMHIDPGRSNYPREPDEPAAAYFECIECVDEPKKGEIMKRWRCQACGQVIEDMMGKGEPPKEHGVFHVRIGEPAIQEKCNGTLEEMSDDWKKNMVGWKNAG